MKIAEFSDSFLPIVDGVGRVVANYASILADKGHEVTVIAPMGRTGFRGRLGYEIVDYASMKFMQYDAGVPRMDPHFTARMKNVDMDVIHVHSPFTAGQAALYYGKQRGIPVVSTFHSKYKDDFRELTKMNAVANIGTNLVVNFYDKCDEVWTVNESSAETLHSYGYKKPIYVMPNGTDEQPATEADVERAKSTFGLGGEPVFLYVGQLNWKKNIGRILSAAAELNKKGRSFKLVFAGMGPHAEEIKAKAASLKLRDKTVFTGHISDHGLLAGLYMTAELFCFPSLYDTAGIVVSEAATNGTPSVVVRGSNAAEPVIDGINGVLCEDTTEDLARLMEAALDDPQKFAEMGKMARRTIPRSWENILDDVVERYQYLIDANDRRPKKRWVAKVKKRQIKAQYRNKGCEKGANTVGG